jgi:DNA-binding LacI/PurR family transcriptional regulator
MATMSDVTRRAKVSVSTVSYVLTGTRPISTATRDRVLAAMADLGYQPNAMARGLASRRSSIVGLVLPLHDRGLGPTESAFVSGATAEARAEGYHLMLCPLDVDDLEELRALATQGLVDGALLMEVRLRDQRVDVLTELGLPFVLIGRTEDPTDVAYVDVDFARTVADAVDHLRSLGHRRIAFVNHGSALLGGGYGPAHRAESAYSDLMRQDGVEPVAVAARDDAQGGRVAARELLSQAPDLTAVLVMNENAAFGLLAELAGTGRSVPQDVSVVSLVTSPAVAELTTPALTSLTSPGADVGRLALRTLLRRLAEPAGAPHQQLVPCTLEVRDSTAPARRSRRRSQGGP